MWSERRKISQGNVNLVHDELNLLFSTLCDLYYIPWQVCAWKKILGDWGRYNRPPPLFFLHKSPLLCIWNMDQRLTLGHWINKTVCFIFCLVNIYKCIPKKGIVIMWCPLGTCLFKIIARLQVWWSSCEFCKYLLESVRRTILNHDIHSHSMMEVLVRWLGFLKFCYAEKRMAPK